MAGKFSDTQNEMERPRKNFPASLPRWEDRRKIFSGKFRNGNPEGKFSGANYGMEIPPENVSHGNSKVFWPPENFPSSTRTCKSTS